MLIASFNCNSVRARMHVLTRWLRDVSPDVLSLQETKVVNEQFPLKDFEAEGYNSVFMGEKSYIWRGDHFKKKDR